MSAVRFRARKTLRFGPYYRIYSSNGGAPRCTSHGIKIGRLTYNLTTRRWSFDTPGPGSLHGGGQ